MSVIKEIKFADVNLVHISNKTKTPHCIHHGAMNKMTKFEDGSGIWRCLGPVSNQIDTYCRTGCQY